MSKESEKEFYLTTTNLHVQEFGCTVNKGMVITVEDGRLYFGALEGDVTNAFRIFVRNGYLRKIDKKDAEKLIKAQDKAPIRKQKVVKKMDVIDGDHDKIEISKIDTRSEDQRIIDQDNGVKIDGMKVEVKESIDIGVKVKDIPTESKEVKSGNGMKARNKAPEKTEVDKAEVQKRKEERIKSAEAAEKELKKAEASSEKKAVEAKADKKADVKTEKALEKVTEAKTEKKVDVKAEKKVTEVKADKSKEIAKKETTIAIKPTEGTSVKSGKAKSEMSEVAETIKME